MLSLAFTALITIVLLLGGVWVAVGLGVAGFVGLLDTLGLERVLSLFGKILWEQNTNFVLIAIPLFIFMGEMLFQSGVMTRIYTNAAKLVSDLPGGLLQTNIAACTLFAACSGSSVASAATIGSVGYPIISKRGYDRSIALGSIAAGGTLGILIPPSVIFIIYGALAEVSVGKLFLAGVLPGLLLASFYSAYIAIRSLLNPALAPREQGVSWAEKLRAAAALWQVALLALVVLGGIYGGVATPTEVAALGATMAVLFAALAGGLTLEVVKRAGMATVRQTSMILFIITTAKLLSLTMIYYRLPNLLIAYIEEVGATSFTVLIMVSLVYLVLGMFFDGISMMVVTIPFVVPIMNLLHVDLIWLGVLICILIEIGLLTPPVGLNLYVLQGATREPIGPIIRGALPFVAMQIVGVVLLFMYPGLALYLPKLFQ